MASPAAIQAASSSGDLVDLVASTGRARVHPSDDAILAVLSARFRSDLPYARIGTTNLVLVNPYKTLANTNDVSAQEYQDRCYKDTSLPMGDAPRPLQPHPYEMAARLYLLMRRRNESQAVIARYSFPLHSSHRVLTVSKRYHWLGQVLRASSSDEPDFTFIVSFKKRGENCRAGQSSFHRP